MRTPHGRHELKILISYAEYLLLKNRVAAVLETDKNAGNEGYFIRSVYFDDFKESVYYEKLNDINDRRKYRIRAYNNNSNYIILECKEKHKQYIHKNSAVIDIETCKALLEGNYDIILNRPESVLNEFYIDCKRLGLKSAVVVDYHRDAFTYPASNVRITFDKELHAGGLNGFDMFFDDKKSELTLPVYMNNSVILEIKYDDYLPAFIRHLIPSFTGVPISISKYCLCRNVNKSIRY